MPVVTCRWQFHAAFSVIQVQDIVSYLAALGIMDYYAAPYVKARPSSIHWRYGGGFMSLRVAQASGGSEARER